MTSTIAGLKIPSADLCHVQWRSLAWVLENGPLNETNAMEYFSHSPFYDRRSTNQVLRMQSMFSGQPPLDSKAEKEALKKLVGIEYTLVVSKPEDDREGGLFVIEKRDRKNPEESYPITSYYILKTCIYQSPSFHAALSCRLLTSLSSLSDLLDLARSRKPIYDPQQGYAWKIKTRHQGFEGGSNTNEHQDQDPNQPELSAYEAQPISPVQRRRPSNHLPMDIDKLETSNTKITPTGVRNPLDDKVEVRNIPLERAFQNALAMFSKPDDNPTQPSITITEVNHSSNPQDDLNNLSQAELNLINSNSSFNLSHSSNDTQSQESLMDETIGGKKTNSSGKRKVKRTT
ncbi:uncharacterized protein MELLADRAFT_93773 [Melampsora larici-populina 98AG31]|uniref:Mediator of RNA polymerase II transcription subunit 6 n=1 Tax=Melampsora larici-populina (strain 98AG31 / pathotype 3-4-7) TaxID=747676 RepID=F4S573_MELLP|nr:uncharacterized protein MELLADRAFT_93773 [Melampsora larici-populina 98AG31]EGG00211.1 hypothetical protein MELLADRAFT_93773 [Melampsora larici-populina 98AG31]